MMSCPETTEPRQSLTNLCFELGRAKSLLTKWKKNGGDLNSLNWVPIDGSMAIADVEKLLSVTLPNTALSIIKVSGDVAPHRHSLSNSAGVTLGEQDGFFYPQAKIDVLLDEEWRKLDLDSLLVFPPGIAHGFRGVTKEEPLYLLFLDSPKIDDEATEHLNP